MPMEILHVMKLRLFAHMLLAGDERMFGAILGNHEWSQDRSWLSGLQRSITWLTEQVGDVSVPVEIMRLEPMQEWIDAKPFARRVKKLLHQATTSHKSRIRTLCTLRAHGNFQKEVIQQLGLELPHESPEALPDDVQCDECDFRAPTRAAIAVHKAKKHGSRMAVRRFVDSHTCAICKRKYHTRPRVLQHLHSGSTDCWIHLMRNAQPMNEERTAELDERDKFEGVARHQGGTKSQQQDRQWCWATQDDLADSQIVLPECLTQTEGPPTEEEIHVWSSYGTLPPGKGGCPRTQRKMDDFSLRHVLRDTRSFEDYIKARATEWKGAVTHIPKPLGGGQKLALVLFSGHRRWGDIASWMEWDSTVTPLCIDLAVDTAHGDVSGEVSGRPS